MKAVFRTDTGKVRANNEDSVYMDVNLCIFILADGMGGHQSGEVASEIAVREAYQFLSSSVSGTDGQEERARSLREACLVANDAVRQKALTHESLNGMGTTLLQLIIERGRAYISNVGDSRAYLFRESLRQLTKDQTVGAFLVEHSLTDHGDIDPANWHVLTQAVGSAERLEPELIELDIQAGDILLLCSDGLTDMLSDDEIAGILAKYSSVLDVAADRLVGAANDKGGHDNISVILIEIESG